jgi:hypothetical protein
MFKIFHILSLFSILFFLSNTLIIPVWASDSEEKEIRLTGLNVYGALSSEIGVSPADIREALDAKQCTIINKNNFRHVLPYLKNEAIDLFIGKVGEISLSRSQLATAKNRIGSQLENDIFAELKSTHNFIYSARDHIAGMAKCKFVNSSNPYNSSYVAAAKPNDPLIAKTGFYNKIFSGVRNNLLRLNMVVDLYNGEIMSLDISQYYADANPNLKMNDPGLNEIIKKYSEMWGVSFITGPRVLSNVAPLNDGSKCFVDIDYNRSWLNVGCKLRREVDKFSIQPYYREPKFKAVLDKYRSTIVEMLIIENNKVKNSKRIGSEGLIL